MEFCPQCTTILNIEKGSISQQGGNSTDNIGEIIDIKIIQNKIFLTTQKSKIILLDPISSEIISIKNMNFKIFNKPIIANNKIYYLDSKKRLIEIN